jgi:epoxyqueuosine reductase
MSAEAPFERHALKEIIRQASLELGFDDCGFSRAEALPQNAQWMEQWLEKGFQGEMSYLERNKEKRYDPRLLVENTLTVVTFLFNYFPAEEVVSSDGYKISKYAYGADYHQLIRDKLMLLLQNIEVHTGPLQARAFTDSAPVLDRAWAEKCGLGFIGKNTCLIHPRKGSFFFIGHLFLPIDLEADEAGVTDYCGTCRRCIDACPTGALVQAHELDAQRCISYLTIEYRGELPAELKPCFKDWIFGCDICQDVCPWNRFSKPHKEPLFALKEELKTMKKTDWHQLTKEKYNELFKKTAVERTKFEGLKRNIDFLKGDDSSD